MQRNTTVGIDIGTYHVKVVVGATNTRSERRFPKIIGAGFAESKGLRHGYIVNSSDVTRGLRDAIRQAEESAGFKIKKAYLSISGVSLEEVRGAGSIVISRADAEVTDLDVNKAIDAAREQIGANQLVNRKVLHTIPLTYRIDGKSVLGRPQGMKGTKLEADVLFITCLEQHHDDLIAATEEIGVEVEDVMASPLAGSLVTTTKTQRMAGSVVANIGAETVSIVVFEDGIPISLKVFPIGSKDITNDIALGLQVSLEEAEQIKRGAVTDTSYSQRKLSEIVVARLSDIFELIEAHLKHIGKNGLLPAGVILTGGGSGIATIEDLARGSLKLPSKVAQLPIGNGGNKVKDASWAVAYGLCIWGSSGGEESMGMQFAKRTGSSLLTWVKQFLP